MKYILLPLFVLWTEQWLSWNIYITEALYNAKPLVPSFQNFFSTAFK